MVGEKLQHNALNPPLASWHPLVALSEANLTIPLACLSSLPEHLQQWQAARCCLQRRSRRKRQSSAKAKKDETQLEAMPEDPSKERKTAEKMTHNEDQNFDKQAEETSEEEPIWDEGTKEEALAAAAPVESLGSSSDSSWEKIEMPKMDIDKPLDTVIEERKARGDPGLQGGRLHRPRGSEGEKKRKWRQAMGISQVARSGRLRIALAAALWQRLRRQLH